MESKLYTFNEVVAMIKQGFILSLAADEKILQELPAGNWIGGTIPYFMDTDACKFNQEEIFVNKIEPYNNEFKIKSYDEHTIQNIVKDSFENGYTLLIIPPFQKIHETYALQAEFLDGLYNNPIVGWIAGTDLKNASSPKTFLGTSHQSFENKAVAIHVKLPENKFAQIDIVNIFKPDENNDEIRFYENTFEVTNCMINGSDTNLAEYINDKKIDYKLPLIADYSGAHINVSIKEVDLENKKVSFFAPVFKSKTYKFPKSIPNYMMEFDKDIKHLSANNQFACNCILNYLYGELEGKKIPNIKGPITFGEIGYQLLNQTLVTLNIDEI